MELIRGSHHLRKKSYGLKGETYDNILRRMMKQVDYEEFMERQYKLLQEKDKFVSLDEI
jgi:hypothetical protein